MVLGVTVNEGPLCLTYFVPAQGGEVWLACWEPNIWSLEEEGGQETLSTGEVSSGKNLQEKRKKDFLNKH